MQPRTLLFATIASLAIAACGDRMESRAAQLAQEPAALRDELTKASADASVAGFAGPAREAQNSAIRKPPTDTASLPTMLIRTGMAELKVDSLEPAIAALEALARRAGGYVGNTSFSAGAERRRSATMQLRVPSGRFGDLQAGLGTIGEIRSLNVNVQDVGEEYTDATARLKSKRQVEERLLGLLRTHVGKLSEIVELERALEGVREEIEATEGRLRYLRNQVGLSTMTVTLNEPGLVIAEPGYHPIRDAFGRAWNNFIGLIAGLVAATGWLIPLLAMIWGGWRWMVRARRKRAEG